MSVFRRIRVFPGHGSRSAVITWSMSSSAPVGDVFVAYSETGTPGTWRVLNSGAGVESTDGIFQDTALNITSGATVGYYRLLMEAGGEDYLSETIGIHGDLTAKEYGMVRAIIHREFTDMRAVNGYPVWHCIPKGKEDGNPSSRLDTDTGEVVGLECPGEGNPSFGMTVQGGFNRPLLTWIRPLQIDRGTIYDSEDEMSPSEKDVTSVRMMAFPQPARGHMIVDPTSDRRYVIGDEIKPFFLRGVMPVAYEATMEYIYPSDVRYLFEVPTIDTKEYRRIPYWTPQT